MCIVSTLISMYETILWFPRRNYPNKLVMKKQSHVWNIGISWNYAGIPHESIQFLIKTQE